MKRGPNAFVESIDVKVFQNGTKHGGEKEK